MTSVLPLFLTGETGDGSRVEGEGRGAGRVGQIEGDGWEGETTSRRVVERELKLLIDLSYYNERKNTMN